MVKQIRIKRIWEITLFFLVIVIVSGAMFFIESGGFYLLAFIISTNMMILSFVLYAMSIYYVGLLDEIKKSQKPEK